MIRYIALLRGINVSGQKTIRMEDLRGHFELPGFQNITTYIQSGNVLFETEETNEELLRANIEANLSEKLGYKVPTIIRMFHDMQKVVKNNPFVMKTADDKGKWYVTFLSDVPERDVRGSLGVYSNDAEYARVVNKEVYIYSPNYGKTCFSNTFIEKKLKVAATTRNWATVNKLLEI